MQGELVEGKVGWITKIMEFDVGIKPTKLIKGYSLYENMVDVGYIISIIKDEEMTNQ